MKAALSVSKLTSKWVGGLQENKTAYQCNIFIQHFKKYPLSILIEYIIGLVHKPYTPHIV